MMTIQLEGGTTVRDLVSRYPQTRQVFEQYDIDYCCHGATSLAEAAEQRDLPLHTLELALAEAMEVNPGSEEAGGKNWSVAPLGELVDHIIQIHHRYVREALPRLRWLVSKVLEAHGDRHGDMLRTVQALVGGLDDELSSHLMKEERILFPYIVALEQGMQSGTKPSAPFGTVANPVQQMEHEHESAGEALRRLREVTSNYALPDDACATFAALFDELQHFESDLHEHIHLENNLLFPRAVEMEQRDV